MKNNVRNTSQIHSGFVQNIIWSKKASNYTIKSSEIHVWNIKVPDHFCDLFKEYRSVLNNEEFHKAKAFYWEEDFRSYLTGRIVLRILLSRYLSKSLSDIRFCTETKKPSVISNTPLKYNLSYAGKYILISIGLCESGIDIENINQDLDFKDILSACFSKEEIEFIDSNVEESRQKFFLHWTRKEALLKYTGQGIIDDLTTVPSMDGKHPIQSNELEIKENVNLSSFFIDFNFTGSLVCPEYISNIKFLEW